MSREIYDCVIAGGGIVGLATAYAYQQRNPGVHLALLEKEPRIAQHQSGRNSGVIHAGIYYPPGSLKAKLCMAGRVSMVDFCQHHGLPYEVCGKLIVATDASELPGLEKLHERAHQNGIEVRCLGSEEARELEPHVHAIAALHVPVTGIADYGAVCAKLAELIQAASGEILLDHRLVSIRSQKTVVLQTTRHELESAYFVNCGGLYSDRIARMAGIKPEAKIVPFRGEYFDLKPERASLVKNLIYPVPNPDFPFLGVHFTRSVHGGVHAGPNAVLAFAREGYGNTNIRWAELVESLSYPGFLRLAGRHFSQGWDELRRSWSKQRFVTSLQRLIPEIKEDDLLSAKSG